MSFADGVLARTAKYEQERNRQKNELSDLYSGLENDTLDLPGIRKILLYLCVGAGIQPRGKDENVDIDLAKQ